jgi:DNA-binding FadR family transcriptional regulator
MPFIFESSDDMMNEAQRVKKQSLAEEVAARLQQQIVAEQYAIGEKLPTEPELMAQFGVGRSSVREAIRILANNGLVKVQQGLGTFVESRTGIGEPLAHRLQKIPFEELNEVREWIEVKIAEKAAQKRTARDIDKMKALLKKRQLCAESGKLAECIQADIDFHTSIAEAARNGIMLDLYRTVATHLKASFLQRYSDTSSFLETQEDHQQLLQSIVEQDARKALGYASRISSRPSR